MENTLGCHGGGALHETMATINGMSLDKYAPDDELQFEQQNSSIHEPIVQETSIEIMRMQLEMKKI